MSIYSYAEEESKHFDEEKTILFGVAALEKALTDTIKEDIDDHRKTYMKRLEEDIAAFKKDWMAGLLEKTILEKSYNVWTIHIPIKDNRWQ